MFSAYVITHETGSLLLVDYILCKLLCCCWTLLRPGLEVLNAALVFTMLYYEEIPASEQRCLIVNTLQQ